MKGPKPGENWKVGSYKNLVFIGIARDFQASQYLIFDDNDSKYKSMFIISKDEFYSAEIDKHRID